MNEQLPETNPYDFRNPVTTGELLAGRDEELDEALKHLAAATEGRPVHIALIGRRAAGKTSLLRVLEGGARRAGLLAVRVDLDESLTASPVTFFKAVFEAVVQALVDGGALGADDSAYAGWLRQVHIGDAEVSPSDQLLLFGMVAAGVLRGAEHPDISPALLAHDCNKLASLARSGGFKGIVLLCDEGDLIGANAALIQKLRNLLQSLDSWMLIAAGTNKMFDTLSDVFSPIPRQFVRITVGPFETFDQAYECIQAPLKQRGEVVKIPIETILDVFNLTGGWPYEINLVSYYMWEELRRRSLTGLELSQDVIDSVLGEIRDFGRRVSSEEIEAVRQLSSDDVRVAAQIIPFEDYTIRELALSQLAPSDYEVAELEERMSSISRDIDRLEILGILRREDDRFKFRGDEFVKIYFKYAAKVVDSKSFSEAPYAHRIITSFFRQAKKDLGIADEPLVGTGTAVMSANADVAHRLGEELSKTVEAIELGDLAALARSVFVPPFLVRDQVRGKESDGLGFIGVAGTSQHFTTIEAGEIMLNIGEAGGHDWQARVDSWVDRQCPVMEKYGFELSQSGSGALEPQLAKELVILTDLRRTFDRAGDRYSSSDFRRALDLLRLALGGAEEYLDGAFVSTDLRETVADGYNRLGFISAVVGDLDEACAALERAAAFQSEWLWLHKYNLAYARAANGDFAVAAELIDASRALMPESIDDVSLLMLLFMPTTLDWSPPTRDWNVVRPGWPVVRELVELQGHAYEHLAGLEHAQHCDRAAEMLEDDDDASLHRLAGWMQLSLLDDLEAAIRHFELASQAPAYKRVAETELAFAQGRKGAG
jgi:tetratricopeptide (TPR) repeat protein